VLPVDAHFKIPARAQSSYRTRRPCTWKGRQQVNVTLMTLYQHLRNTGCIAKVSINLKRRMGIEKIQVETTLLTIAHVVRIHWCEQQLNQTMGMIAIAQPRPQINFPC